MSHLFCLFNLFICKTIRHISNTQWNLETAVWKSEIITLAEKADGTGHYNVKFNKPELEIQMLYVFSYMPTVYFKFFTQCACMRVGHNTRKCIMRRGLKKEWK